uniref:Uncharacterized protein n=1 Tax=Lepeophtheirus salmonis TaxID=72036 RepID=A0A0K2U8E0_LEPSM
MIPLNYSGNDYCH